MCVYVYVCACVKNELPTCELHQMAVLDVPACMHAYTCMHTHVCELYQMAVLDVPVYV